MAILFRKINLQRFSEADGHLTFDTSIDTGGVEGGIKKLGSLFNDAAKALGGGSFEKSISSFEKVGRSVSDMSSTVQRSTKGMAAAGKDIAGIAKPLESSGTSVMKFSDYVKSGMNTVKDTLSTAKTNLSDFGKAAQTALGDLASGRTIGSAIEKFKGFGSSVLESVSSLGGSEGKIASFVKTTRGNLDTLGGNLITGVIDKFKSLGQGIANSAGNLGGSEGKISGFFSGVKAKLADFGGGLVSGIIDKFKNLGKAALSSGDDLERSSGSFGRGASGIQQALAVMAGNLMTEAVHKLVDLGKSALTAGADLQQSIGGIETLFGTNGAQSVEEYAQMMGKSVDEVQEEYDRLSKAQELALGNADKAWKTAGLSANDYMQTVTSFAASLKAAPGDELKAAELADQAVIDMADNANKMGTDMASIQHAYQGFSKQNYTMLDNLKLGKPRHCRAA